jgi:hypothetical protein
MTGADEQVMVWKTNFDSFMEDYVVPQVLNNSQQQQQQQQQRPSLPPAPPAAPLPAAPAQELVEISFSLPSQNPNPNPPRGGGGGGSSRPPVDITEVRPRSE